MIHPLNCLFSGHLIYKEDQHTDVSEYCTLYEATFELQYILDLQTEGQIN